MGVSDVEIVPTHQVEDGMHSAIVRAVMPVSPVADAGSCGGSC
jgi:hypothetical protein